MPNLCQQQLWLWPRTLQRGTWSAPSCSHGHCRVGESPGEPQGRGNSLWAGGWKVEKQCRSCCCCKHQTPLDCARYQHLLCPQLHSPGEGRDQTPRRAPEPCKGENKQECIFHADSANLWMANVETPSMAVQRNWEWGERARNTRLFPAFWIFKDELILKAFHQTAISKIILLLSQDATWSHTGQVLKFNRKNAWICTRCIYKEKS